MYHNKLEISREPSVLLSPASQTSKVVLTKPLHTLSLSQFLHQYQLIREQLRSLDKTSLCQYAAAASEMPYSDV